MDTNFTCILYIFGINISNTLFIEHVLSNNLYTTMMISDQ